MRGAERISLKIFVFKMLPESWGVINFFAGSNNAPRCGCNGETLGDSESPWSKPDSRSAGSGGFIG